ncbi:MAG: AraC family transcriptional regulator, partial [Oscillospiraceae bacterium]|nr:AraC family transcriptional regulator [Oscillospiraceae bacterium]
MKRVNKDAINNTVEYIENRLLEKLNMDELAGQIYFSKTHFQRLFHQIVGEPVMEYIKKRRLQHACQTLCQSNSTVLDIALQYGYESHEGFTRAFKALYGVPPAQYRKMHTCKHLQKSNNEEGFYMLSSEVTKGIVQHTKIIADALSKFNKGLEELCNNGEKTVIEQDPAGCGVMILIQELRHLINKVEHVIESVNGFSGENQSVYEASDTIYSLMKTLDDTAFQTHLLRFLSGIEVARTGNMDPFITFQNDFKALVDSLHKNYFAVVDLLKELLSLLLID